MSGVYSHGMGPGERDTTMRDLIAVVFKRKWLILSIFLVTTVTVGVKTLSSPVTYSAGSSVVLNRQGLRASQLQRTGKTLPWVEVVETEVEVVRSVPVLQAAVDRLREPTPEFPEGINSSVGQLKNKIRAVVSGESNVLYIVANALDPDKAMRFSNSVAEAYLEQHKELFKVPSAAKGIRVQADSTFTELESMQSRRSQLLAKVGLTETREEERSLVGQRGKLRLELGEKSIERSTLEAEIEDGRRYLASDLTQASVPFEQSSGTTQGLAITQAAHDLRRKALDLAELRNKYTEQHPKVVDLRVQVERTENELSFAVKEAIGVREHQLRVKRDVIAELERQIAEVDRKLRELPPLMRDLNLIDSQITATSKHFDRLTQQAIESEVNEASAFDYGAQLLSPAVAAERNKKGDLVRMALGPILALVAGVGLAFYLENLDHSLQNREDIERHLEIPVLASFPDVDMSDQSLNERARRLPYQKSQKSG